jgi:hypothetical protein
MWNGRSILIDGPVDKYVASGFDLVKKPSALAIPTGMSRPQRANVWCWSGVPATSSAKLFKKKRAVICKKQASKKNNGVCLVKVEHKKIGFWWLPWQNLKVEFLLWTQGYEIGHLGL